VHRPVNRESDTPIGTYQIWHREGDQLQQVGGLKVANLLVAAEVAMNHPPAEWMDGEAAKDARRTRTGDVIVSPREGAFKIVETTYGFTFEQTSLSGMQKLLREIAEFREDFQMGQEEAARGEFAELFKSRNAPPAREPPQQEHQRQMEREGRDM
jgi:hypothetical protein